VLIKSVTDSSQPEELYHTPVNFLIQTVFLLHYIGILLKYIATTFRVLLYVCYQIIRMWKAVTKTAQHLTVVV